MKCYRVLFVLDLRIFFLAHLVIDADSQWSQDDLLLFLQQCELDDVASVMIGYDVTGADIAKWNNDTLAKLGIENDESRQKLLGHLDALKRQQREPDTSRIPLFKLVRSATYDKVVAVETCLSTRDITVAEGRFGCLQVTKVNGANIPLKEQDCFLEINGKPGQLFRSPLMFTKLISDVAGEPIRLVVLRRRINSDEGDEDIGTSAKECYSEGASHLREQVSI
ncbi:unnamed protein product [Enterobius vermicularis]|uniref:SAM domain-containing protein n=1 Tax=Enterobius vermicularis TaxID=51028 RepID=A0A3P6IV93_ENTVE|nr:unnamed protein product [Enterobius vermicularis]